MWEGERGTGSLDDPAGPGSGGLFGDAETRAFYEELPDLLSAVPLTILGFTPEQVMTITFDAFVFVSPEIGHPNGINNPYLQ